MNSGLVIDTVIAGAGGLAGGWVASSSQSQMAITYWYVPWIAGGGASLYFLRGYPVGMDMLVPIGLATVGGYLALYYTFGGSKINVL